MYTPERFLNFAKEYLEVDIKEESISQVKNISESKEAEEVEKQSNLTTGSSIFHLCPSCGKQASLLITSETLAGEPAIVYRLQCSNCGYKNFTAQHE